MDAEHHNFDEQEFFQSIIQKNAKSQALPGVKFNYSNLDYVILGNLIETVSGTSFKTYVEDHIIAKLAIDNEVLGFTIPHPANHAKGYHPKWSLTNMVLGFFVDKKKFMATTERKWRAFNLFHVNGSAYGGLIGPPMAFVKYIQALLTKDLLISDYYKNCLFEEQFIAKGRKTGMCLSWFKGRLNGHTYYCHAGGGGGYYSEIRIYPELNRGSVIFFNRSGMKDERFFG